MMVSLARVLKHCTVIHTNWHYMSNNKPEEMKQIVRLKLLMRTRMRNLGVDVRDVLDCSVTQVCTNMGCAQRAF